MRAAVFFVYFFFLLMGGNSSAWTTQAYAGTHYIQSQHSLPSQFMSAALPGEDGAMISDADLTPEDDRLVSGDLDDEDTGHFLAGISQLLASYYRAFSQLFSSEHDSRSYSELPLVSGPPSPKYLTLRVLRL